MLINKCNMTIAHDITESCQKIMKITGIVMSQIPVMHLRIKRCPKTLRTQLPVWVMTFTCYDIVVIKHQAINEVCTLLFNQTC